MKMKDLFLAMILAAASASAAESGFSSFITRRGNNLIDGEREFRFMGANMPGLVLPYDFTQRLPERMRLPSAWEQEDAFQTLDRMNLRVVRTWNLPMRSAGEKAKPWHYVLGPGVFNEEAFRCLDRALALANRYRVRMIIPLSAGWGDYLGGIRCYAEHRGKPAKDVWTDPQLRQDYQATVKYVLNRVNSVTGVPYREDKAILAWEFGNEMCSATPAWIAEMAAYIKSLDANHLVAETRSNLQTPAIDPNVDLLTSHYYESDCNEWMGSLKRFMKKADGQRPFFAGEFGAYPDGKRFTVANTEGQLRKFLDTCRQTDGVSGACVWSMYFHHQDGGFWWHQIFTFPSVWAYHFPGFPSAEKQAETGILRVLREEAYLIEGKPVPPLPVPQAPELLPFQDVPMFSWRGSAGASGYDVERQAESAPGAWQVIAENVSDADAAYRPLFSDVTAEVGKRYSYRVVARNASGKSPASNVVGPIEIKKVCLVDEFKDLSLCSHSAGITLDNSFNAQYAEHLFRALGTTNDWVLYEAKGPVRKIRLTAYFAPRKGQRGDPDFLVSPDGKTFQKMNVLFCRRQALPSPPQGGRDATLQLDYTVTPPPGMRFVKIVWRDSLLFDRVEIVW